MRAERTVDRTPFHQSGDLAGLVASALISAVSRARPLWRQSLASERDVAGLGGYGLPSLVRRAGPRMRVASPDQGIVRPVARGCRNDLAPELTTEGKDKSLRGRSDHCRPAFIDRSTCRVAREVSNQDRWRGQHDLKVYRRRARASVNHAKDLSIHLGRKLGCRQSHLFISTARQVAHDVQEICRRPARKPDGTGGQNAGRHRDDCRSRGYRPGSCANFHSVGSLSYLLNPHVRTDRKRRRHTRNQITATG